jgi:hypothetical protein
MTYVQGQRDYLKAHGRQNSLQASSGRNPLKVPVPDEAAGHVYFNKSNNRNA